MFCSPWDVEVLRQLAVLVESLMTDGPEQMHRYAHMKLHTSSSVRSLETWSFSCFPSFIILFPSSWNIINHKTENALHRPADTRDFSTPTGAEEDQVAALFFFLPPPHLVLPVSLKLMPRRAALEAFLTRMRGVSLITSQGTLISVSNIWFTLSWRDSCIKSRNNPNQFKLHPPPSLPHLFAYKTSTLGLRVQRLSCCLPYICLPPATTNQEGGWRDEGREKT